jgi:hypothetical protein
MNQQDRDRIDQLNDKIDRQHELVLGKIETLTQGQARLVGIVTNGLTHRVQENHERLTRLIENSPTRTEVTAMVAGCYDADRQQDTRQMERKRIVAMWLPPIVVAAITVAGTFAARAILGG